MLFVRLYEILRSYSIFNLVQDSWLPSCRIQVTLQGLEWFLYNRTAAYENILAQMEKSMGRDTLRSRDANRSSQGLSSLSEYNQLLQLARLILRLTQNQGDNQR